ncbi:hypothetical protein K443DRAFT_9137 [Laccaria amethystina LaAM-08-1]|uniref:CNH domain-containing protein n=1 Tax=Laccaria amethystina LaAM-08-1 TaxID=1095629 RepID=A0A0C9XLQ5_9AGAR|nr:hypothetical protein K443DRAFT_9137 [Laccaria amethystina LaAM-08-1]
MILKGLESGALHVDVKVLITNWAAPQFLRSTFLPLEWDGPSPRDAGDSALFQGVENGPTEAERVSAETRGLEPLEVTSVTVNPVVVLSESTVTLFPPPTLSPPTPLVKAKAAFSFGIHSSVQYFYPNGKSDKAPEVDFNNPNNNPKPVPTIVTQLVVGCRRKVVIYSWKDGEPQEAKEVSLPHSARVVTFLNPDTACFAYSPTEYAIFSISTMSAVDVVTPLPVTSSKGTLTGLTGYMILGLGAKSKPAVVQAGDSEALIAKDIIEWRAHPEELTVVSPYIFSILPPGTVPISPAEGSPTIGTTQTQPSLYHPPSPTTPSSSAVQFPPNTAIRLMTTSSSAKFPLILTTTPTDRTAAIAEGSSIWQFSMKSWSEQIDELVLAGKYSDALALLDTIDEALLPDKGQRRIKIRALNAVAQFRDSKFDAAIDTFMELDFNPAKVVALYPDAVAGRLSVPQNGWIPLYGGPTPIDPDDSQDSIKDMVTDLLDTISSGTDSIGGRIRKTGLGMFMPSAAKDDDIASVIGKRKFVLHDDLHRPVETLVRYLADHPSGKIPTTLNYHRRRPVALPNAPLSALTPDQLLRFTQIVDTALYKSYLIIRPTLLSSLCRIANWCEVSEVEEDLRAR